MMSASREQPESLFHCCKRIWSKTCLNDKIRATCLTSDQYKCLLDFQCYILNHIIAFNGLLIYECFLIYEVIVNEVLLGFNPTPT